MLQERFPIRQQPAGAGRKVSERLVELIDPYVVEGIPAEQYRLLVAAGVLAWNLALLPPGERKRDLGTAQREVSVDPEQQRLFRKLIEELSARKELLFPADNRVIASWNVEDLGNERYHLTAAFLTS